MDEGTPGSRNFLAPSMASRGPGTFYPQTSRGNAAYPGPSLKRSYDSTDNIPRSCLKTPCVPSEGGRHDSGRDMNPMDTPRKSVRFDSGFIDGSMDSTELPEMIDCSTSSSCQSSAQLTDNAWRDTRHMSVSSESSSTKDLQLSFEAYPTRKDDSRHNLESNSKCSPEEMAGTQHGYSSNSAPIKPINAPVELITQRTSSYSYNTTSLSVPFQTSTSLKTPQHPFSSQFMSMPNAVSSQEAAHVLHGRSGSSVHQDWTMSEGKTSRTEQTPTGSVRAPDTAWAPFKQPLPPDSQVVTSRRPEAVCINQPKRELFKPSPGAIRSVSQVCSQLLCPLIFRYHYQKKRI